MSTGDTFAKLMARRWKRLRAAAPAKLPAFDAAADAVDEALETFTSRWWS